MMEQETAAHPSVLAGRAQGQWGLLGCSPRVAESDLTVRLSTCTRLRMGVGLAGAVGFRSSEQRGLRADGCILVREL